MSAFLKAAINGGRTRAEHRAVPLTAAEIAHAAAGALAAGADVVHAHARGPGGAESILAADVAAMVRAFRRRCPAGAIGTTTGLWTCSSHAERMASIASWPTDALPTFASVAFSEPGAAEAAQLICDRGMRLESAVWSLADVPALLDSATLSRNERILIEPEVENGTAAVAQCRDIAARLRAAGVRAPLLYHGAGEATWPVLRAAQADGVQARIGFEDSVYREDGTLARDNADMVRAACLS